MYNKISYEIVKKKQAVLEKMMWTNCYAYLKAMDQTIQLENKLELSKSMQAYQMAQS